MYYNTVYEFFWFSFSLAQGYNPQPIWNSKCLKSTSPSNVRNIVYLREWNALLPRSSDSHKGTKERDVKFMQLKLAVEVFSLSL